MCKVYSNKVIHLCIMAVSHELIEKAKIDHPNESSVS